MNHPVVCGTDLIAIIDRRGAITWNIGGTERQACLIDSSSELAVDSYLVRVSHGKVSYHQIVSPLFWLHGQLALVAAPWEPAGSQPLSGQAGQYKPVLIHQMCRYHQGKLHRWHDNVRWLILK